MESSDQPLTRQNICWNNMDRQDEILHSCILSEQDDICWFLLTRKQIGLFFTSLNEELHEASNIYACKRDMLVVTLFKEIPK